MQEALTVPVNYWAVLVAAVAAMIFGGLWYSPLLFGKAWMKGAGFTQADMEKAKKKGMWKSYLFNFLSLLVLAFVLQQLVVNSMKAAGFLSLEGFSRFLFLLDDMILFWVGFVATIMLSSVIWEGRPFYYYLVNVFHWLFSLLVMTAVYVYWPA